MKSGASDPFADDDDESEEEAESETETAQNPPEPSHRGQSDESVIPESTTGQSARSDYPLKLRRENVKDERENVHQLFVLDETDRKARNAERDLEDDLGEDIYRLDAREAIYLAGMQNLDDAAAILREWGYDL